MLHHLFVQVNHFNLDEGEKRFENEALGKVEPAQDENYSPSNWIYVTENNLDIQSGVLGKFFRRLPLLPINRFEVDRAFFH